MNKGVILLLAPCVLALLVVIVQGQYYGGYAGYAGIGAGAGANAIARQRYQQRYIQEVIRARQSRTQLNNLAQTSTFSKFVNYIPLVLLLTTLTNRTGIPIIG